MKALFLMFSIATSISVTAQINIGSKGGNANRIELHQFTNCIQKGAWVDNLSQYICREYLDTITRKYIVCIEKENRVLDIISIGLLKDEEHLVIGSNESGKPNSFNTFVVAVDCCYRIEDWPTHSKNIHKAWMFNKTTNKFEKLNVKKVYRINEGFYY